MLIVGKNNIFNANFVEMEASSMHGALFKYIESITAISLSRDHKDLLKEVFVPKKLRKRQYFLQAGEVCNSGAFIINGAMKQYSVDDEGHEHIIELMLENWWAGDWESMTMGTPSPYYIDALEETDVLLISVKNFSLIRSIPAVAKMGQTMGDRRVNALYKRIHGAISLSAEQRFEKLYETYPEFLQRFPQHIIASYLGITKETLSRIRSQAMRKGN